VKIKVVCFFKNIGVLLLTLNFHLHGKLASHIVNTINQNPFEEVVTSELIKKIVALNGTERCMTLL